MVLNLRRYLILLPPYLWMVLLLLLPMIAVLCISFSEYSQSIPPFKLFISSTTDGIKINPNFENFSILFTDRFYLKAYFNSLTIAFISTICTLVISYPVVLGIAQAKGRMKNLLLFLLILPFWSSLIIRTYAWNVILGDAGLINKFLMHFEVINAPLEFMNSNLAVIIGIVYCYLPFMALPLFIVIDKIDKSIIEASLDLGCTPWQAFKQVILPLSIPGILSGSVLVFIPAVGEFIIPDLLGGNKILTIGKVIWIEFFNNRDWPVASAITILLILIFVTPVVLIQKRMLRSSEESE